MRAENDWFGGSVADEVPRDVSKGTGMSIDGQTVDRLLFPLRGLTAVLSSLDLA